MAIPLDWSADYLSWDFQERVTFTSAAAGGRAEVSFPVEPTLRGQPTAKERAPTGGAYAGSDLQWLLPFPMLRGNAVKPADTVTAADGTVYTVLQPGYDQLDQVWDCYSVALSIAHQLADRLTVWAPANAQDRAGSRVATYAQTYGPTDARFQLVDESQEEARGKQLWRRTYEAYVAAEVELTNECQVRDGDGNVYQVTGYKNRGRIDELSVISCVRYGD